jgi:hypothetical protein
MNKFSLYLLLYCIYKRYALGRIKDGMFKNMKTSASVWQLGGEIALLGTITYKYLYTVGYRFCEGSTIGSGIIYI